MSQRQGYGKHRHDGPGSSITIEAEPPRRVVSLKPGGRRHVRIHGDELDAVDGKPADGDVVGATANASCSGSTAAAGYCSNVADSPEPGPRSLADLPDTDDNDLAEGEPEAPTPSERLQVATLTGTKHGHRVSEPNLRKMQLVPTLLMEILDEVTAGDMAFDLRGKLREVRIVFDEHDDQHAVVSMTTDGHANQAFNIQIGSD